MANSSTQDKLFLLEFLVDFVCIERSEEMLQGMDNDPCLWNRAQTCVTFQFLDYPPLEITQEDFATKKCAQEGVSLFKNGKSCLFSVAGAELNNNCQFAVDVAVHKKLPTEVLPGQVLIGNSTIQLADIFNDIVNIVKKNPECVPISKTMKDGYFIKSPSGKTVGEIRVFIRLSCFGKLIVTHFELGGSNKPYLFRGSEGSDIYECQKLESKMNTASCKNRSAGGRQPMKQPNMMPGGYGRPQYPPMSPQRGFQPYSSPYPYQQPTTNAGICSPEVCATKDDKDFEEIGAEVNGHALKIRVPKKKKKKEIDNCGPCAPCVPPPETSNWGVQCPPCKESYGPTSGGPNQGMTSICGPCSPCGEITVLPPEQAQNTGIDFGATGLGGSPFDQGHESCGPCSPCNTLFGGPPSQAQDACGPCAPCGTSSFGNNMGPKSQGQDSCGPCAPCGNSFGNDYAHQNQTMEGCGPCAPCGGGGGPSYGNQTTMDSCGPCAPCGSSYGAQMPQTDACGPCAPCGDPYGGGQMAQMGGYGGYPQFDPYSQGYGGQMPGMEPCPPCAPPGQSNQMNQMIFNQPCQAGQAGQPPKSNLFYKVTACPEECTAAVGGVCKKAIKIEPQIGAQQLNELPENLGRDVFVLRIGKHGDSPDHKSNLELELRTPKRPPPPSEMKETQYSEADTKKKKGKHKKKKDKKGKKGKDKKKKHKKK